LTFSSRLFFLEEFLFSIQTMATIYIRKSWADDDSVGSDAPPRSPYAADPGSDDASSRRSEHARYRISYTKHPTTFARHLYDVDGYPLTDEDRRPVNLFTAKMKDMLAAGKITCYHRPGRPGYRYFCTSQAQAEAFRKAREKGMTASATPYHVYPDEPGCVLPYESSKARTTAP
jgi:hypothetical protein